MKKKWFIVCLILISLLLSGCYGIKVELQPRGREVSASEDGVVAQVAASPTAMPSATSTHTETATVTERATSTPTATNTPTNTATPSATYTMAPTPTPSMGQLVHEACLATVRLGVTWEGYEIAWGSGSIIDARGWILTNLHVLADDEGTLLNAAGEAFVYMVHDPNVPPQRAYVATLYDWDAAQDLALLKITADQFGRPLPGSLDLPTVQLGDSDPEALPIYAPVTLIGFPDLGSDTLTVSDGAIAGRVTKDDGQWLKTTAKSSSGSSGGVALNQWGEVVGIPTQGYEKYGNSMGYLRPINEARALIDRTLGQPLTSICGPKERTLRIVYQGPDPVKVYAHPWLESEVRGSLPYDTRCYVIPPANSGPWWAVYDQRGLYGWIRTCTPEGVTLAIQEMQRATAWLEVGDLAQVMCLNPNRDGGCLNIRRTPGYLQASYGDVIKTLPGGTLLTVLKGPVIKDETFWYQVEVSYGGVTGWVAETTGSGSRILFPLR